MDKDATDVLEDVAGERNDDVVSSDDGEILAEEPEPGERKVEFFELKAEDVLVGSDVSRGSPASRKAPAPHHVLLDDFDKDAFARRVSERLGDWTPLSLGPGRRVNDSSSATLMEVHEENLEWDEMDGKDQPIDEEPVLDEMILSIPTSLYNRLFRHQRQAVRFMWTLFRARLGGLIADEMGLGKTVQVIAFIAALFYSGELAKEDLLLETREDQNRMKYDAVEANTMDTWIDSLWSHPMEPILIICPTTLMSQWVTEFNEFFPLPRIQVIHRDATHQLRHITHAQSRKRIQTHGGIFLTSFETLRSHLSFFDKVEWFYGVIDEGQKIRNPDALVTLAVKKLRIRNRLLLSGSPIQNDLKEFWSLFDFIQPGKLGTLPVFTEHFGDPIMKSGLSSHAAERGQQAASLLKTLVFPHMIRRTKVELINGGVGAQSLGLDLPTKDEQVVLCPLSLAQYQIYVDFLVTHHVQAEVSKRFLQPRMRKRGEEELHQKSLWYISVLSKICNHPDLLLLRSPTDQWPSDFGAINRSGKLKVLMGILSAWRQNQQKALIFSQTNQVLDIIENAVEKEKYRFLRLDGRTPIPNRLKMVTEFNASKDLDFMLLTTRVGGLGLNLTGAARVIIFDPDWNPTVDSQAQERAWRIGQGQNVIVYRLLSQGTLEQKVYKRQLYKNLLAQKVLTNLPQQQQMRAQDFLELFAYPPAPKELEALADGGSGLSDRLRRLLIKASAGHASKGLPLDLGSELKARRDLDEGTPASSQSSYSEAGQVSEEEEEEEDEEEEGAENSEAGLLEMIFKSNQVAGVIDHKAAMRESNELLSASGDKNTLTALQAIKKSQANRAAYGSHIPTWTGRSGVAGRPIALASESQPKASGTFSELEKALGSNHEVWNPDWKRASLAEKRLVVMICDYFGKRERAEWEASTGEILTHFGPFIATEKEKVFFRDVLKKLCEQIKGTPVKWRLKEDARDALRMKKRMIDQKYFQNEEVKKSKRKIDSEDEWA